MGTLDRKARDFDRHEPPPKKAPYTVQARTICDVLEVKLAEQGDRIERAVKHYGMGTIETWMREVTFRERNHEIHRSQLWDLFLEQFPDEWREKQ